MLTMTLPFDDFFAVSESFESTPEPWMRSLMALLAPHPVSRILFAGSNRDVLSLWSGSKKPSAGVDLDQLSDALWSGDGWKFHPLTSDASLAIYREFEAPPEHDATVLVVQLESAVAAIEERIGAEPTQFHAAAEMALALENRRQRIEIVDARNTQLVRQQAVFQKEHEQTLEAILKERDARLEEQRSYVDRLEREVALRTAELNEQAIQLRNANQRMKRNLESAARIQTALLPTSLPKRDQVHFSWKFRPCDELAGDSLNVFNLDEEHVGLYVLDVSGHGVPSALLSVTLSRILMPVAGQASMLKSPKKTPPYYEINSPADVAVRLNRQFPMTDSTEQYFTILYGILNVKTGLFRYVSAGHPGLVYQPAQSEPAIRETESFAIGWFDDVEYDVQELQLHPGDRLFMYSDGITESADADGKSFGNQRLLEQVASTRAMELDAGVESLLEKVLDWTGQRSPQDDLSILALEIR